MQIITDKNQSYERRRTETRRKDANAESKKKVEKKNGEQDVGSCYETERQSDSERSYILAVMRYLIDTNIFVYLSTDIESLSKDVAALIREPEAVLYISAESVRELIVGYRNKRLCSKRWKSEESMVAAIEKEFYVKILPLKKEHMQTYARLQINEAQGHKDPSDHVIIAHRSTCLFSPATLVLNSIASKGLT